MASIRYRRKAEEVRAMRLEWDTWQEIGAALGWEPGGLKKGQPEGCYLNSEGQPTFDGKPSPTTAKPRMGLIIPTAAGEVLAREGDFIIRDAKGMFYALPEPTFREVFVHLAPLPEKSGPWRIVETDNYCGDYPNESFEGPVFQSFARAEMVADLMNEEGGKSSLRFYKVVSSSYELAPGFEP